MTLLEHEREVLKMAELSRTRYRNDSTRYQLRGGRGQGAGGNCPPVAVFLGGAEEEGALKGASEH